MNNKNEIKKSNMPLFCPECNKLMNKRLDKKMWSIHNKCSSCVIKEETKIRAEGKWEEYQNKVIEKNIKSYLKNEKKICEENIEGLKSLQYIQNSEGNVEKWNIPAERISLLKEKYEKHLEEVKEYLNKLQKGE